RTRSSRRATAASPMTFPLVRARLHLYHVVHVPCGTHTQPGGPPMSTKREIDIHVDTAATPDTVFALLADSTTWPAWPTIESVTLEREGSPDPDGVGAIRVNTRGRVVGRDEILEVVPKQRFVYRSLSGLPVRDYVGRVTLERTVTGTSIHWHSEFFPKVP